MNPIHSIRLYHKSSTHYFLVNKLELPIRCGWNGNKSNLIKESGVYGENCGYKSGWVFCNQNEYQWN